MRTALSIASVALGAILVVALMPQLFRLRMG
jgi:ABC-type antimicrobial peptide transport system permease subunit